MTNLNQEVVDFNEIRITGISYDEIHYKAEGKCSSAFGSLASRKETGAINFIKFAAFGEVADKINTLNIKPEERIALKGSLEFKRYKATDGSSKGTYRIVVYDIKRI